MIWQVPKIWEDAECWIIGGGSSMVSLFEIPSKIVEKVSAKLMPSKAYSPYMEVLHDRHVMGVNNAYQIGIWIDVMFYGDGSWYLVHRERLAYWPGLKVTCDRRFGNRKKEDMEGIKFLPKDNKRRNGISQNPRTVSWNGNSGGAAISLAAHLGVKRIFLLGFDMYRDNDTLHTHWHGNHCIDGTIPLKLPPFRKHMKGFPAIARDAKERGIEIYNLSPKSKITAFPKITLKEALNGTCASCG